MEMREVSSQREWHVGKLWVRVWHVGGLERHAVYQNHRIQEGAGERDQRDRQSHLGKSCQPVGHSDFYPQVRVEPPKGS